VTDKTPSWVADALKVSRAEGEYLAAQLNALRSTRGKWRRYRLHQVVCQGCGDVLAEVIATQPVSVVCFRRLGDQPELASPARSHIMPIRRTGEWTFRRLEPLPGPTGSTPFLTKCSCRNAWVSMTQLYADLVAGLGRRVLPSRDTPGHTLPDVGVDDLD